MRAFNKAFCFRFVLHQISGNFWPCCRIPISRSLDFCKPPFNKNQKSPSPPHPVICAWSNTVILPPECSNYFRLPDFETNCFPYRFAKRNSTVRRSRTGKSLALDLFGSTATMHTCGRKRDMIASFRIISYNYIGHKYSFQFIILKKKNNN